MWTNCSGVIVGDLPPAYITVERVPNPASALDSYLGEMAAWVEAVRAGQPVDELIPVETTGGGELLEPTAEHAEMLDTRLQDARYPGFKMLDTRLQFLA
jgi:hypothetical protein